jgi:AAA15 family ATPase/GTPase
MLVQFIFKNYKSFKEEACLDLTATKITEHNSRVVDLGNTRLLRVAAIYGANASGKSNVFSALRYMSEYVRNSFNFGGETALNRLYFETQFQCKPFAFDEDDDRESSFEVFYIDPEDPRERTIQYGFAIKKQKIVEEWLTIKAKSSLPENAKTVFYRKAGEPTNFGSMSNTYRDNIQVSLADEVLILSLGAKLKVPMLEEVNKWFSKIYCIDFGDDIESNAYNKRIHRILGMEGSIASEMIKYLGTFDTSIVGIEKVETDTQSPQQSTKQDQFKAVHLMNGGKTRKAIPLEEESQGTIKMLGMYPAIKLALSYGSVLAIDELNTKLHPLLVRNIILTFANPEINVNNAQLIFTTHDSWQLETKLLRRDEIWFTEKNASNESSLYSLAEFHDEDGAKIRKDASYEKDYLAGLYGAIPKIKPLDFMKEE